MFNKDKNGYHIACNFCGDNFGEISYPTISEASSKLLSEQKEGKQWLTVRSKYKQIYDKHFCPDCYDYGLRKYSPYWPISKNEIVPY